MSIDFDKMQGLVPAIIQDSRTKNVLLYEPRSIRHDRRNRQGDIL